jgi:hypothetical protein
MVTRRRRGKRRAFFQAERIPVKAQSLIVVIRRDHDAAIGDAPFLRHGILPYRSATEAHDKNLPKTIKINISNKGP